MATTVRGLTLPDLLLRLIDQERWWHPGDPRLRKVMPWFEDPVEFLATVDEIRFESRSLDTIASSHRSRVVFRAVHGRDHGGTVQLPLLDVDAAVLIAVCRNIGDDVSIALDYRTDPTNPRVVATDFWTHRGQCEWRTVTATFSEFVAQLGLLNNRDPRWWWRRTSARLVRRLRHHRSRS